MLRGFFVQGSISIGQITTFGLWRFPVRVRVTLLAMISVIMFCIPLLCNGSTSDSDSASRGSNPCGGTKKTRTALAVPGLLFSFKTVISYFS
jgi:hypothetical protein